MSDSSQSKQLVVQGLCFKCFYLNLKNRGEVFNCAEFNLPVDGKVQTCPGFMPISQGLDQLIVNMKAQQ